MTRPSLPDHWQDLIAGYTLGNLSPDEAEAFQQLLATEPDFASEVQAFQEVLALMPQALPDREPPPHLRGKILHAASQSQAVAIRPSTPRRQWAWGWSVGWAIAAGVIAVLGMDNYRLRQTLHETETLVQSLQRPNTVVYALSGTEGATGASGNLVVDTQQRSLVIFVQGLPTLPTSQAYRLWALADATSAPTYCGQFNSRADGTLSLQWRSPEQLCNVPDVQMLITAEPAAAPPIPQGKLVMKSSES